MGMKMFWLKPHSSSAGSYIVHYNLSALGAERIITAICNGYYAKSITDDSRFGLPRDINTDTVERWGIGYPINNIEDYVWSNLTLVIAESSAWSNYHISSKALPTWHKFYSQYDVPVNVEDIFEYHNPDSLTSKATISELGGYTFPTGAYTDIKANYDDFNHYYREFTSNGTYEWYEGVPLELYRYKNDKANEFTVLKGTAPMINPRTSTTLASNKHIITKTGTLQYHKPDYQHPTTHVHITYADGGTAIWEDVPYKVLFGLIGPGGSGGKGYNQTVLGGSGGGGGGGGGQVWGILDWTDGTAIPFSFNIEQPSKLDLTLQANKGGKGANGSKGNDSSGGTGGTTSGSSSKVQILKTITDRSGGKGIDYDMGGSSNKGNQGNPQTNTNISITLGPSSQRVVSTDVGTIGQKEGAGGGGGGCAAAEYAGEGGKGGKGESEESGAAGKPGALIFYW